MKEIRERETLGEKERREERVVKRERSWSNEVLVFKTRIYSGFGFLKKRFHF